MVEGGGAMHDLFTDPTRNHSKLYEIRIYFHIHYMYLLSNVLYQDGPIEYHVLVDLW